MPPVDVIQVPASWCEELCERLRSSDYDADAFLWARDALVAHLNRLPYSQDASILQRLRSEPANDATCSRIKQALQLELRSQDARRAGTAASFLGESGDPTHVPILKMALRRQLEAFMATHSAMTSLVYALEHCGEKLGDGDWGVDPLKTMRDAQEYLKRNGYDYVPW